MRNRRGFLLLEVIISIVVITGGLLFVMRVYSTAKEALNRSRTFFKYSLLLEEKIYDFEERGIIEEGKEDDHFPDLRDYFWEAEASSLASVAPELNDLCTVRLDVFRHQSSSEGTSPPEKYSLYTYLNKKK